MAFVERCLYPFILHKCSDEFFINMLSLFLILRLKFQQILQWPCPNGRHLENLKTQPAHSIFNKSAGHTKRGHEIAEQPGDFHTIKMASMLLRVAGEGTFLRSLVPCVNLIPVRFRVRRKMPSKIRNNPFVQRRTDFIKKLVLALVQHERIQTTDWKAQQLKKYAELVRVNVVRLIRCDFSHFLGLVKFDFSRLPHFPPHSTPPPQFPFSPHPCYITLACND